MQRLIITFSIMSLIMISCVHVQHEAKESTSIFSPPLSDPLLFAGEIKWLRTLADNHNGIAVPVDIHLELALLYSNYLNPEPDYSMALKELERYIELYPRGVESDDILNFYSLLKVIQSGTGTQKLKTKIKQMDKEANVEKSVRRKLQAEIKTLQTETTALRKEREDLTKEIEILTESNKNLFKETVDLKHTIEKLKMLDMQLEKKRKSFR